MPITLYHVDAFTDQLFCGNPAAVCLLDSWLPEVTLQELAKEMNLMYFYLNHWGLQTYVVEAFLYTLVLSNLWPRITGITGNKCLMIS